MRSIPAEKAANEWLAENGLCAKLLLKLELEIQQTSTACGAQFTKTPYNATK